MAKPTKKELAEALYRFAHFNSTGIRGVVRMMAMQEEAKKLLNRLGDQPNGK